MIVHKEISITLNDNEWGQIIEGLTSRAEQYEQTAQYYETGYSPHPILEVNNAEEARKLAAWFHEIICKLENRLSASQHNQKY